MNNNVRANTTFTQHAPIRALATLLAVMLAVTFALPATFARADEGNGATEFPYQYKVRVFPGNCGALSDFPVTVWVNKGDNINLYDIATPTITNEKYVHTGYRLSGSDDLLGNGTINGISEDMDFVVAYGMDGELVPYTLQFVEYETGRELAASRTYHGKDGEKPVAAFEYIEGYRPRYASITGTLDKTKDNVWTFEYIPLEEGETIVTTTTSTRVVPTTTVQTTTVPGTTTYTTEAATPTTTTTTTTPSPTPTATNATETTRPTTTTTTTANEPAGNATTTTTPTNQNENANTPTSQQYSPTVVTPIEQTAPPTQEILDLDNPMASPDDLDDTSSSTSSSSNRPSSTPENETGSAAEGGLLSNPLLIAGIGAAVIAGAGLLVFLAKRKNDEDEDNEI